MPASLILKTLFLQPKELQKQIKLINRVLERFFGDISRVIPKDMGLITGIKINAQRCHKGENEEGPARRSVEGSLIIKDTYT